MGQKGSKSNKLPKLSVLESSLNSETDNISTTQDTRPDKIESSNDFHRNIASIIQSRGIAKSAHLFWKKRMKSQSKVAKQKITQCALNVVLSQLDNVSGDICLISFVSSILEAIQSNAMMELSNLIQKSAQMCVKYEISVDTLLELWKRFSNLLNEMFSDFYFTFVDQYCLDTMAIYIISLINREISCQSLQYSRSGDSIVNIESLLDEIVNIDFTQSTLQCLTHPFGVEYLCRYIDESSWCSDFDILQCWRLHSIYRRNNETLDSESDTYAQLRVFIYDTLPNIYVEETIISDQTLQKIQSQFESNRHICFDELFTAVITWLDNNVLETFISYLKKPDKNNLQIIDI